VEAEPEMAAALNCAYDRWRDRHADQILVIDKGAIIERGPHTDLMMKKGFYFDLYMSQFRGKLSGIVKE
jgi:ABC-type transport system involved in cytochrome bd biosynthesis fused ATPase/permease subunit